MKSQNPTHRSNRVTNLRFLLALMLAMAALMLIASPRQLVSALRGQPGAAQKTSSARRDKGMLPSLAPPVACTTPPPDMIGWWPGENNANDIQGTNNGTLQGTVSFPLGEVGQAFGLNGTDANVKVPASSSLNVGAGSGLTLDLWVNPTSASTAEPLIEWNNPAAVVPYGTHLWINVFAAGDLYPNLVDTSGAFHTLPSNGGVIVAGIYQHIALTYDKASGIATVYRNGVIVAGPTNLGSFTPQTSYDLYFGLRPSSGNRYTGSLDEIEVFNRALSQSEIQSIYDSGSTGTCQSLSISDTSVIPGAIGTTNAIFTVSVARPNPSGVTVDYATADGTAHQPADYSSTSGTLTIPANTSSATISVPVNGLARSSNQNFNVNLSSPSNAIIQRSSAVGTIQIAPTLGNYPDTPISLSGDTTVIPDAAPVETTSFNISTNSTFKGTFGIDLVTGVVRVTDAHPHPAGIYPVTVKAFGPGGSATKTFLLTVTNGTACGGISGFTPATTPEVNVQGYPGSVALGDFNGDGKQDMAVGNEQSASISIRLGNGDGTFFSATPPEVGVSDNPHSVAVGDFNGDGKQDLASVNIIGGSVSIRLGVGDGTFTSPSPAQIAVGPRPFQVALGDFNGDGKLDFAAVNETSNNVSIRLGVGDGTFTSPGTPEVTVGSTPHALAIGDFDGNGALDFATANSGSNTISIRLGDGLGGFTSATTPEVTVGTNPAFVAIGDFNGDGTQDFAATNNTANNVSIRLGNGDGTFASPTLPNAPEVSVGSQPREVAIGDFNNDGKQDLAVVNFSSSDVSIRFGDGTGHFTLPATSEYPIPINPQAIAIGDFNGDGHQDFLATNYQNANTVSVRLGGCTGAPAAATTISAVSGSGTYGDNGTLTATLTSNNSGVSGKSVSFTLNSNPVGSATTNGSGVATLTGVSLSGINAGPAYSNAVGASFAGDAGYLTSSGTGDLTVSKATPTITWSNPSDIVYGTALSGTQLNASASVTGAAVNPFVYTPSSGTVLHAGNTQNLHVVFTPDDTTNYNTATKDVSINVTKAALTITADDMSKSYRQANPTFTFTPTGFVNGDPASILSGTPTLTTTATTTSVVNTYTITISQNTLSAAHNSFDDYSFNFVNGTLTINKATPVISWSNPTDITYGTALSSTQLTATATNPNDGSTVPGTFTYNPAASTVLNAGNGQTLATNFAPNGVDATSYNTPAQKTVSINVLKATLTITADDQSKSYRTANPTLTFTPSGFVNSDTSSVLAGAPDLTTTATTTSDAGGYTITAAQGTLSAANYTFSFVNGTLTVNKATPLISWSNPADVAYGTALGNTQLNATATNPNDSSSVAGTFTYNPLSGIVLHAGNGQTLAGNFAPADTNNYNVPAQKTVSINVLKATLTITAASKSKTYRAANPSLTFTPTGFVNGDTASVFGATTPGLTTTATTTSPATSYPITIAQDTLSAADYSFTFVNGTLTVNKATPTISWSNPSDLVYGTALGSTQLNATATNPNDSSSVTGAFTYNPAAASVLHSGNGQTLATTFTPSDATNYNTPAQKTVSINVTKATLTVTADNKARPLNTANPTLTFTPIGFVNGDTATVLGGAPGLTTTATMGNSVGDYPITITPGTLSATDYGFTFVNGTLSVGKTAPVINWSNPADIVYGTALTRDVQLNATATDPNTNASLAGTFTYPQESAVLHFGNSQTLSVTFAASDTTNYIVPPQKTVTINVTKRTLTITADNKARGYRAPSPAFTFTPSGFVNGDTASLLGANTPSLSTTAVTTDVVGNYPITPGLGTLNATDYSFSFVNGTLAINKATPTINWSNPVDIVFGTAFSGTQLNATATNPNDGSTVTAAVGSNYNPASATVLNAGSNQVLAFTFIPSDTTNYNTPAQKSVSINVLKADQTITFGALANKTFGGEDFNVSATASSGLGVSFAGSGSCTVSTNTVHLAGSGSCTITASQSGDSNYNAAANVPQAFNVGKVDQTITFGALATKTFGDADFTVSATASSTLVVSFAAGSQCTISGNTVHITGAGACTITASQAGDNTRNAATSVPQSFNIAKANQTIAFATMANRTVGDPPFTVSALASSSLAISFSVVSGPATISGNTVTITGAGTVTVRASQAGDSNFNAAASSDQSFDVANATAITFKPQNAFGVGRQPRGILSADLNGDGKPDLVTVNTDNNSNNVTVLLGDGLGGFSAGQSYSVVLGNQKPAAVAVGDLNGDGKPDIVTGNLTSNLQGSINVLLNNGSGGFGSPQTRQIAGNTNDLVPGSIKLADLNGDGKLDLAVGSAPVAIFLGNGNGTFQNPTFIDGSSDLVGAIAVGDFNGDGKLDIAKIVSNNLVFIYCGDGTGKFPASLFSSAARGPNAVAITAADVNGDGKLDVVLGNQNQGTTANNVSVLLGKGDRTFKPAVNYNANWSKDIAVGDLNGDGRPDIVTTGGAFTIDALLGNGDGTFKPFFSVPLISAQQSPQAVTVADFNRNGRLDIAAVIQDVNGIGSTAVFLDNLPPAQTPTGTGVSVQEGAVKLNFTGVSIAGTTTSTPIDPNSAGALPGGFAIGGASLAFDVTTTAAFTAPITICFNVPLLNGQTSAQFSALKVLHGENGVLVDRTLSHDFAARSICASVNSLSPFLVATDQNAPVTNENDDPTKFVRQHYLDFLSREPDTSGSSFWTSTITTCGSNQSCIDVRRINASAAFFLSIEFQQEGYLVERTYKAAYGDNAGTSALGGAHQMAVPNVRLNQFLGDAAEVGQDVVVNQGNWQQQLDDNKNAFMLDFVQRTGFAEAYPTTLTPAQFVNQLFTNAGITPSSTDLATAIGRFGGASISADATARAKALRDVAENSAFMSAEMNRAFVLMQYFGYLRRNPNEGQDTDYTGYDFWLRKLNQFNGNFVNAQMVKAFITSSEYRQRFGQN